MPRRGFTLIELLVVIGVITVLSAIAIPAIGWAKAKAREAKCRAFIAQMQSGLESFRTNVGTYPEGPITRTSSGLVRPPANDTANAWAAAFEKGNKRVNDVQEAQWHRINISLREMLAALGGEDFRTHPAIEPHILCPICNAPVRDHMLDPFAPFETAMVYRYRPSRYYRFDGSNGADVPRIDSDDPPGRDSYQLWSCGRDGIDQFGAKSDDITSWR